MFDITSFDGPNRFLSNFWPAPVVAKDGTEFGTVEQAFQYEKFLGDWPTLEEARKKLRATNTPAAAKRIAKQYLKLLSADWHERKLDVMRRLLAQKFKAGSKLAAMLDGTGDVKLIEGNNWGDKFWGVYKGEGENHLGRLLMQIRNENRQKE